LPHDFIFNRDWYDRFDGRAEFDEYQKQATKLDASDRAELLDLLSSCDPRDFIALSRQTTNRRILRVLPFYVPRSKELLRDIWERQRMLTRLDVTADMGFAEDERVEDAGLDFDETDELPGKLQGREPSRKKVAA
jgi:hypothetical protein